MEENKIDPTIGYDVVELPSRGIHYNNKKKSVRIAYLTAADENILASPNLLAVKGVVNEILKRKVLDKDLPIDEIVEEDRQAILIFLRNTSFGSEYKLKLNDPKTDKEFTTNIDLSTLKLKDFDLVEDSMGEYKYFLEVSGKEITFKFLTQKQEVEFQKLNDEWKDNDGVVPAVTKKLEMLIKSIDGDRNIMGIYGFINDKMPILDSQKFRKYVSDNKPGLDLTRSVETPSKETIQVKVGFGMEFFRPFYGL